MIQTTALSALRPYGVHIDLMMALVVYISLRARWQDVFVANCAMGLLRDVYSPAPFGTFGLLFLLCGLLVGWMARRTHGVHPLTQIAIAFVAVIACDATAALLLAFRNDLPHVALMRPVLWQAVFTALAMPLLSGLMARPARWLRLSTGAARG